MFFLQIAGSPSAAYPPASSFYEPITGFIGEFLVTGTPSIVSVNIDITPGSFPNSINLDANGGIPVAILSTSMFDAPAEVDPSTLTLAGAGVRVVGRDKPQCSAEDLDGNGLEDLICHFTNDLTVAPGDSVAVLEGKTLGGVGIRGQDNIRIVPQR